MEKDQEIMSPSQARGCLWEVGNEAGRETGKFLEVWQYLIKLYSQVLFPLLFLQFLQHNILNVTLKLYNKNIKSAYSMIIPKMH